MNRNILPVFALLIIGIVACKKYISSTSPGPYSMASVYSLLINQPKTVTLDAVAGGSFYGNSGTRYIFPPNAFQTSAGVPVTGSVIVEVNEFLNCGDMIFSGILPVSNGEPLISGGEIYVNATQGGQTLRMNASTPFQANIPQHGTPVAGMQLFIGGNGTTDTLPDTNVNWVMIDTATKPDTTTGTGTITPIGTITYNIDTISIFSDTMGYCNADQFMTNPAYQTFTVTATGVTVPYTTLVFIYAHYDTYNAVWGAGILSNVANEDHIPNIPVHFIVYTVVNGNFYGGILGATPSSGSNYNVPLTQITPAAFKAQVNGL